MVGAVVSGYILKVESNGDFTVKWEWGEGAKFLA